MKNETIREVWEATVRTDYGNGAASRVTRPPVPTPDTCPSCGATYIRRSSLQTAGGPCPVCRARRNQRAMRERRAAAGMCTRCGRRPPGGGRAYCDECTTATNAKAPAPA